MSIELFIYSYVSKAFHEQAMCVWFPIGEARLLLNSHIFERSVKVFWILHGIPESI